MSSLDSLGLLGDPELSLDRLGEFLVARIDWNPGGVGDANDPGKLRRDTHAEAFGNRLGSLRPWDGRLLRAAIAMCILYQWKAGDSRTSLSRPAPC
jgi:hypothetical protein